MISIERHAEVFVLRVDAGENRFRWDSIRAWNDALDEVEKATGPKALVTTGTGKFYSNGLDLEWALAEIPELMGEYLGAVLAIMGRLLTKDDDSPKSAFDAIKQSSIAVELIATVANPRLAIGGTEQIALEVQFDDGSRIDATSSPSTQYIAVNPEVIQVKAQVRDWV